MGCSWDLELVGAVDAGGDLEGEEEGPDRVVLPLGDVERGLAADPRELGGPERERAGEPLARLGPLGIEIIAAGLAGRAAVLVAGGGAPAPGELPEQLGVAVEVGEGLAGDLAAPVDPLGLQRQHLRAL